MKIDCKWGKLVEVGVATAAGWEDRMDMVEEELGEVG